MAALVALFALFHRYHQPGFFDRIATGMTRDEVLAEAGLPELLTHQHQTELWMYGIHHVRSHPGEYEDARNYSFEADVVVIFPQGNKTVATIDRSQHWAVSLTPREVPWWFSYALY